MTWKIELTGAVAAVTIVGPLTWMALDRDPPVKVINVKEAKEVVERGASFHPDYETIWLRRCSGESRRVIVDAAHIVHEQDPYQFRDGIAANGMPIPLDHPIAMPPLSVPVPYGAAPGPATYQATSRFYCNALQKALGPTWRWFGIDFRFPAIAFEVKATAVDKVAQPTTTFAPVTFDRNRADILSQEAPPPPTDAIGEQP